MVRHRLILLLALIFSVLAAGELDAKQLIRVDLTNPAVFESLPKGLDIAGGGTIVGWIDIVVDEQDLAAVRRAGVPFQVLLTDVEQAQAGASRDYHTFPGMTTDLGNIAATYPSIAQLTILGTSHQSRNVYCLEISDNVGVDEGEPEVAFIGLHHAREWPSLEVCMYICNQLTSQYGSDPDVTAMVNTRRIFVIPCMNPDGFVYCHDQGHDWRKNRHYFPEYGTYGVDLNRNYGGSTNGAAIGDWGDVSNGGTTHYPSEETYCGPGSMSELETQIIRDFLMSHKIACGITYHTYSELVLWPWGYATNAYAPDNALLQSVGQQIASRISKQYGGTYTASKSSGLYPTTGDTCDWAYGHSFYQQGLNTFFYTIETCASFQPPWSQMAQVMSENWDGALYLLQQADAILAGTTPWTLPPLVDAPETDADGSYTISWAEANPDAGADLFQLDELSDLSIVTDNVESGSGLWTVSNFSISTSRYHSATHSFKSHSSSYTTGTITSVHPVPVSAGDDLTFWTWYNTEEDWDYGVVEVSLDGRKWDDLGLFTGSSGGWVQKTYPLDAYAGKSIYIRFTYTTDPNTLGEGFYVDDIHPVPDFGTVTTLAASTANTSFDVSGRTDGDYYYRVKAHGPVHGWADFSTLAKTTVELGGGQDPVPDIKIDGQDGPLTIPSSQVITLTVSLDPGDLAGVPHDYWVAAAKSNTFWWKWPGTWTYIQTRAYGGPLISLNNLVITTAKIPLGTWTFTFAVDAMNNVYEGTYKDTIQVTSY